VLVNGIEFDRHCGIGATTRAGSDGAAWAMMRPSTFLTLATPLPQPRESLHWITGEILKGTALCPAELRLRLPPNGMAAVSAHEGRHRMTALREILDDAPVPVRLCVAGIAWDEVDAVLLAHLRRGMRAQRSGTAVEGPLFGESEPDLGGARVSGIPPPAFAVRTHLTTGKGGPMFQASNGSALRPFHRLPLPTAWYAVSGRCTNGVAQPCSAGWFPSTGVGYSSLEKRPAAPCGSLLFWIAHGGSRDAATVRSVR